MSFEDRIKKVYELGIWPEDPRTQEGMRRYQIAINQFEKLIKHEWLTEVLKRSRQIRLLEICAGAGIGGVAFAKVLKHRGYDVSLVLTDIREEQLAIGKVWGEEELGIKVSTFKSDVAEIHKLGVKADIVLMYGYSAAHFDPWKMIRILASISDVLEDSGLFIAQEGDRVYNIFYRVGFKDFLAEKVTDEKLIISIHAGYDVRSGTFKRAYVDLKNPQEHIILSTYYWNIAGLAALAWIFFHDVDFYQIGGITDGFLITKQPRRKIRLDDLATLPRIISGK